MPVYPGAATTSGYSSLGEVGGTHRLVLEREHDLQAQRVAEAAKQLGGAGQVVEGYDVDRVSLKVGSS